MTAYNAAGESSYSGKKNGWTDEEPAPSSSLTISSTSVSMNWGSGNEASVTVTCGGTYSVSSPDYDVPSSVIGSGYNYEWLNVSKSGSTITFTPKRANYSASSRSATVTVSYGSMSKDITVTQKACGETAPKLTLKRSVTYSHRDDIGTFSLPQEDMDIDIYSQTNVRKLTAHLWDKGATSGFPIATCTDALSKGKIHFDISNLSAGDYEIRVYTSNSATENEYYKQTAFSSEPFLLYFSLTGGNTGNISITGITVPASSYTQGSVFNLTGTITSTYPLSTVTVSVIKTSNDGVVLSKSRSNINKTTYDIKSTINYDIPFSTIPSGTYYLKYEATLTGDASLYAQWKQTSGTYLLGDVNMDGKLSMSDFVKTITCIFVKNYPIKYPGSLDFNKDGSINMSDAIKLLVYIFTGTGIKA